MASLQISERLSENLKKQLALAVRSIQWSYAIYWSSSTSHPGSLEWADGYYNGDIKTRKTNQATDLKADQLGLWRSEQLRELYESLTAEAANTQARRSLPSLSPEDLSDTEWYYLVCMSFIFNLGQGLPGRTMENGLPMWLCNAHNADSKTFCRSLLAKSASIQTIACFPFWEGVVEIGITEVVPEDLSLIQHVKTFLEMEYPASCEKPNPVDTMENDIFETNLDVEKECEELEVMSPLNSSDSFELNQPTEDTFDVEGIHGEASQVQSWNFLDNDLSNCLHNSVNSNDHISQSLLDPEKAVSIAEDSHLNDGCLQEDQDCNHTKETSMDLQSGDLHYQSILSSLFKTSHQLILGPQYQNNNQVSSFIPWKKRGLVKCQKSRIGSSQRLLKKILFEVPRIYGGRFNGCSKDNGNKGAISRPAVDDVLMERRPESELDERLMILRSIVPSVSKVDNISVLDTTISYLKELQKRIEELESCREFAEPESRSKRKSQLQETIERTSDNYRDNNTSNWKKSAVKKRKAGDVDEIEQSTKHIASNESSTNSINVRINDKDVLINMRCAWKEGILLEIVDALSKHHLDSHSIQSSTADDILHLTIKSKFKGSKTASSGMIKQALQRVARNF